MEEEVKKLTAERDALKSQLGGVVDELKGERSKKQEVEAKLTLKEAELAEATKKLNTNPGPQDTEEVVRKLLGEKDQQSAIENKNKAIESFKNKYKEFHPDNDPGGVKFAALQQKLNRFSSEGLKTEQDFFGIMEDAYILTTGNKPQPRDVAPFAASPSSSGFQPRQADVNGLTDKEDKLIQTLGWTKERYLKQKASKPRYVAELLDGFKV